MDLGKEVVIRRCSNKHQRPSRLGLSNEPLPVTRTLVQSLLQTHVWSMGGTLVRGLCGTW
jgi:hypothetical protein